MLSDTFGQMRFLSRLGTNRLSRAGAVVAFLQAHPSAQRRGLVFEEVAAINESGVDSMLPDSAGGVAKIHSKAGGGDHDVGSGSRRDFSAGPHTTRHPGPHRAAPDEEQA